MKISFLLLIFLPAIAWGNICDRTPQVHQKISEILKKDCGEINKEDLAGITTLVLGNRGIHLKIGDFEELSSLSHLDLSSNQITSIEKGSFAGLSSLSTLHLGGNRIASIERGSFEDLSSLSTLGLRRNQITSIEKGIFEGLSSLQQLILGGNQISTLEKGGFEGFSSLKHLSLYSNQITSIEKGSFEGLSSLSHLVLEGNKISSIEKGSFEELSSLSYLSLESNQITSIEKGSFKGLSSLRHLDLSWSQISSIEEGSFKGLSSLEHLNLYSNKITSIEKGSFEGLSSLSDLNLGINKISSIEEESFEGLSSLSALLLGWNQITSIEKGTFGGLSSLRRLHLNSNQISSIEKGSFERLSSLDELNLESNKLTSVTEGSISSYFCYRGKLALGGNPLPPETISYYESLRGVKVINPYQCLLSKSNLKWKDLGAEHFHLLTMLLNENSEITQVEEVVPLLEGALARDFKKLPIVSHYGYGLIPSLDGSVEGLHYVRQLAVEVCAIASEFCKTRQEIHAFPTKEHLKATKALKEKLIKANAPSEHIAKTQELERALEQMFSMGLNYKELRAKLPTGALLNKIDGLFNRNTWDLFEIGEAFVLIQAELLSQNEQWSKEYFHPWFKVKGYLLHQFKTIFWQSRDDYTKEELFEALLLMSEGTSLLRQRETSYLRSAVQRGGDLKALTKKAIDWQLKNMEREHFPQVKNPKYSPLNPKFEKPQKKLQEVFEKMIRTSVITEWDELKEGLL